MGTIEDVVYKRPERGDWFYVPELRRVYYCVSEGHWTTHDHLHTRDEATEHVTKQLG